MENSKRCKTRDRLSELPDLLIFHIFWFLPIIEAVRTTILSKRWEDLWTTVPFLNVDDSTMNYFSDRTRVRNFVNRALLLWGGIKILKFKINFTCVNEESCVNDIDVWVRFAKEKAAAELELHLPKIDLPEFYQAYILPQCVYSCSSLQVLSLKGCRLRRINGNVKWDRLKSLTICVDYGCLGQHVISQVLCGSPKLEVFNLALNDFHQSLCIQSSSLKKLSIENFVEEWPWGNDELKIRTPNLETLEISGVTYKKCLLNASSLTDVTLGFHGHENCAYDDELNELLEETLRQILPTIRHVESVTLSSWCVKVLKAMKRIYLLSPFPKVEFLKLNSSFSKHEQLVGLLEIFPKLERLVVIEEKYEDEEYDQEWLKFGANLCSKEEIEANLPISFLLQLRRVEVTWAESDDSIFPFIEMLLKYASKLEKMVFRVKGIMPPSNSLFSASQKLLRMPRSSPTSQLIFCEY